MRILPVCLGFALASLVCAADSPRNFHEVMAELRREYDRIDATEYATYEEHVAAAVAVRKRLAGQIDPSTLTLDQINEATNRRLVFDAKSGVDRRAAYRAALREFIAKPDAQGGLAAMYDWRIVRLDDGDASGLLALKAVSHPGVVPALTKTEGHHVWYALRHAVEHSRTDEACDALSRILDSIPDNFHADNIWGTSDLYEALVATENAPAIEAAERLQKTILLIGPGRIEKLNPLIDDDWWARRELAFLAHAQTRMNLLNSAGPDFEFRWWSGSDDPPVNSLSDLRGDVVVLVFWSSTCGFCHVAFDRTREVVQRYRDKPVRIVNLSSPEEYFAVDYDAEEFVETPTIAEESAAVLELMRRRSLDWTFAIADELDYEPQYGVRGVPSMAVLDHNGVVRAVDRHPNMPHEELFALIDSLLAERAVERAPNAPE